MRIKSIFFVLCTLAMLLFSGCYKTGFGELSGGSDGGDGGGDGGDDDTQPRLYLADFNSLTAENESKLASSTEWVILDSGEWDEQTATFNIASSQFDGFKNTLKAQSETIDLIFENIQCIPDGVFWDSDLTMIGKVELPKAIYIGNYSFATTSITSISMPSYTGDTSYGYQNGNSAFNFCTSLTSISADNMLYAAAYMFNYCTSIESVTLPILERLGYMSFTDCHSLESITLPSYTNSGNTSYQIHGTNLKYVELATASGVTITEIGDTFFNDGTNGSGSNTYIKISDLPSATLKIGSKSSYIIDEGNKRLYESYNSSKQSGYYTFGTIEVVDNN